MTLDMDITPRVFFFLPSNYSVGERVCKEVFFLLTLHCPQSGCESRDCKHFRWSGLIVAEGSLIF